MVCQVVMINMTINVKQRLSVNIIYLFYNILISINFGNKNFIYLYLALIQDLFLQFHIFIKLRQHVTTNSHENTM
jgi:hypothetical protein